VAVGYVRPARPDDAGEIARIQLTTWRVAYRKLLPRRVVDQLDPAWLASRWRESIEAPPSPAHRILVAIEQSVPASPAPAAPAAGADPAAPATATADAAHRGGPSEAAPDPATYLVGFAAAGPADEAALAPDEQSDALDAGTAAVTELLIEPRWGRRGHGSRLLSACVAGWRADGLSTAVAWAYEQDPATRAFLSAAGWEPDGARRALDVDDQLVHQLRLHTRLAG